MNNALAILWITVLIAVLACLGYNSYYHSDRYTFVSYNNASVVAITDDEGTFFVISNQKYRSFCKDIKTPDGAGSIEFSTASDWHPVYDFQGKLKEKESSNYDFEAKDCSVSKTGKGA